MLGDQILSLNINSMRSFEEKGSQLRMDREIDDRSLEILSYVSSQSLHIEPIIYNAFKNAGLK